MVEKFSATTQTTTLGRREFHNCVRISYHSYNVNGKQGDVHGTCKKQGSDTLGMKKVTDRKQNRQIDKSLKMLEGSIFELISRGMGFGIGI